MAERLEYVGPFDAVQVLVGARRYVSVRNAAWDGEPPAAVADLPTSIVVSDEFAATLLPPEGEEGGPNAVWRRGGGKVAQQAQLADDPSAGSVRWEQPEEGLAVHPVTGYVSTADLQLSPEDRQNAADEGGDASVTAQVTAKDSPAALAEEQVDLDPANEAQEEAS